MHLLEQMRAMRLRVELHEPAVLKDQKHEPVLIGGCAGGMVLPAQRAEKLFS
jgi:hypothetical protein